MSVLSPNTKSFAWQWGPRLRTEFDRLGLSWRVVRRIPKEELGSSPGDVLYLNETFVFERTCPKRWVLHELAHYLVCRSVVPDLLTEKNFGFEIRGERRKQIEEHSGFAISDLETVCCDVNIALMMIFQMPWRKTALELNATEPYEEDFELFVPRRGRIGEHLAHSRYRKLWIRARNGILSKSYPYLKDHYSDVYPAFEAKELIS